ncbi:MAG: Gp37-like protein [Isosphaeraceae bacterium]
MKTEEGHQALWDGIMARRAKVEELRLRAPYIRLWDGDYRLRGEVAGWREVEFEFIENDTGTCSLKLSLSHYLAKWVMDFRGRDKRNVQITIDKQGARWSGFMDSYKVVKEKGDKDRYLLITFKHDYEQAKHILCWANPFLRPELQFPKLWVIFGPAKWCLMMTLFVNIFRLETSIWTLPDNPLDPNEYFPLSLNISNWRNVVKPFPLLGDNSGLTIVFSRFKTWHDTAKKELAVNQLTVNCRRYLDGDQHPFADLLGELDNPVTENLFSAIPLRHGCLVWDILDKSAWGQGTAFGGSLLTGFVRALVNIADDGVTEGIDVYTGEPTFPGEYYDPWFLGTSPAYPWAVFEEGLWSGIDESEFEYFEATDTSVVTGGHSMPGVNEGISALVNMGGDFVTSLLNSVLGAATAAGPFDAVPAIDLPPLGGVMDAVAKILYEDTFLAFMEIPTLRASPLGQFLPLTGLEATPTSLGDFHFFEGWADGADRAFTLSALMAARKKIWDTRPRFTQKIKVSDASPYIFGERGYGHLWLGDRAGTTVLGFPDPHAVFIERIRKISYKWTKDGPEGWKVELGHRDPEDPALKALDWIREINSNMGVLGIL